MMLVTTFLSLTVPEPSGSGIALLLIGTCNIAETNRESTYSNVHDLCLIMMLVTKFLSLTVPEPSGSGIALLLIGTIAETNEPRHGISNNVTF